MTSYATLKKLFKRISHLQYLQRIVNWDEAVMMPAGGGKSRAAALATMEYFIHKLLIQKKVARLLQEAKQETNLSLWDQANLAWMEKKYLRASCIPAKLAKEATQATIASEQIWRKARKENDWQTFYPYLERSFQYSKEIAKRRADKLGMSLYDTVLDDLTPGFNQQSIDQIFTKLRTELIALLPAIINKQSQQKMVEPKGKFDIPLQKEFCNRLMQTLGLDPEYGRLDISHHPFCSGGPRDIRITTRYAEDEILSAIFAVCHETGHALYEFGLPEEWLDQPVGQAQSLAMHESQSLLIEMQVCHAQAFLEFLSKQLNDTFGQQPAFAAENLYNLANRVQPSLIRVDADEVTYPLHIMIRFEIEKRLFNDEIKIIDLPHYWNDLSQEYLGITTHDDYANGVMQDVHWPSNAYGFPIYTLGRLIAAQLFATYQQTDPNFSNNLRQGNVVPLVAWLKKFVHSQASLLTTNTLLQQVTGQTLNPDYFLNHIKQRYLQ